MDKKNCFEAGAVLARLHSKDIIHGDYTPANLIESYTESGGKKIVVIDFGLSFISNDIEDKATDVFTMLRAIDEKDAFLAGYKSYAKAERVFERVKVIEKRVRYAV